MVGAGLGVMGVLWFRVLGMVALLELLDQPCDFHSGHLASFPLDLFDQGAELLWILRKKGIAHQGTPFPLMISFVLFKVNFFNINVRIWTFCKIC